jgi:hypothetical protein
MNVFFLSFIINAQAVDQDEVIVLFDQSGSIQTFDSKFAAKELVINFVKANYLKYQISLVGFDEDNHFHFKINSNQNTDIDTIVKNIEEIKTYGLATDLEKPFSYLIDQPKPELIRLVLIISDGRPDIWDKKLDYLSKIIRADERYSELNTLYKSLKASEDVPLMTYNKLFPLYFQKNLTFIDERISLVKKVLAGRIIIWDISGDSEYLKRWSKTLSAQYVSIPTNKAQLDEAVTTIQKKADEIINEPIPDTATLPIKIDNSKDIIKDNPLADSITTKQDSYKKEDNSNIMLQENLILFLLFLLIIASILLIIVYRKLRQKSNAVFSSMDKSSDQQLLEILKANNPEPSLTDVSQHNQLTEVMPKEDINENNQQITTDYNKLIDEFEALKVELEIEQAKTSQISKLKENLKSSNEEKIFFEQEAIALKNKSEEIQYKYNILTSENMTLKEEFAKIQSAMQTNSAETFLPDERKIFEQEIEKLKNEFSLINNKINEKHNELNKLFEDNNALKDQLLKVEAQNQSLQAKITEMEQLRGRVEQGLVYEQEIERLKSEFNLINQRVSDTQNESSKLAQENIMLKEELAKNDTNLIRVAALEVSNKDKLSEINQFKASLKEGEQKRLDFERKFNETISVYQQLEQEHTNYDTKLIEERDRLIVELDLRETTKTSVMLSPVNERVKKMTERIKEYNENESRYVDEIESLKASNFSLRKQVDSAIETVNLALTRIEQLKNDKAV